MQRAVTAGGMLATKHSSLCQKLSPLLRFSLPLSLLHLSSVCVYLVLSLSSLPCYRLPSLLSFSFTIWSFFVTQRCRLLEALPPTHRHTHCNTHLNTHKHRPVTFKTHCPGDVCDDVWHCHGVLCICKHYTLCQNLIWCHPNKKNLQVDEVIMEQTRKSGDVVMEAQVSIGRSSGRMLLFHFFKTETSNFLEKTVPKTYYKISWFIWRGDGQKVKQSTNLQSVHTAHQNIRASCYHL